MDDPMKLPLMVFGVVLSLLLMGQAMPHQHMIIARWPEFDFRTKVLAVIGTVIIDLVCLLPGVAAGMAYVWITVHGG